MLVVAVLAALARAGDYHSETTLRCSDCHVMHYSQSHGYGSNGSGLVRPLGSFAMPKLLRASVNDLCTSCHDGDLAATDVLDAENTGSQLGIVRASGYLARDGVSTAPHGGHRLDSFDLAPGSSPSWSAASENTPGVGLTCINCHDAHGDPGSNHPTGGQYRNLRDDPGFSSNLWVTYNQTSGANDLMRDVYVRQPLAYDEAMMDWNEPNPNRSAIARWCLACHTDMHGGGNLKAFAGGSQNLIALLDEHPFEGEDLENDMISQYNSLVNRVKVMSEIGQWSPAGSDATPTCVTCHRAHGNANPYGLIFRSGTGIPTENGDTNGTTVTNLCNQCHEGGTP
ncbi:MAG: cytochrome c3 family protein [Planctomycetes bacterium]|nr:cytochrome c3 family protein [Planctomycetota bacterium]